MSDQHHDDFGGLHRDLAATGAAIDRRGLLRLGARLGAAFGLAAHPFRGLPEPRDLHKPEQQDRGVADRAAKYDDLVYATAGYEQSVRNQAQVTLASDMVFSDGASLELATMIGDVASGFRATLTVAV